MEETYPKITKDKFFISSRKKMNREEFFNNQKPFDIDYNEKYICIHCNKIIEAKNYTITQEEKNGEKLITCPNAPKCDGKIIDWWENAEKNRNFYNI